MKFQLFKIYIALLIVGLINCSQTEESHPNDYLILDDITESYISDQKPSFSNISFSFDTLAKIVFENISEIKPIGTISHLTIDSFGNSLVLDSQKSTVYIFDKFGDYKFKFARIGRGPGEFQEPRGLTLVNDSLVIVSDGVIKIEAFKIKRENNNSIDTVTHFKTIPLEISPRTICAIDNYLFISSVHRNKSSNKEYRVIRINLDNGDNQEISFGDAYPNEDPRIIDAYSQGRINCNSSLKTISFLYDRIPLMETYNIDGKLLSKFAFPSMRSFKTELITENGRRGIMHLPPDDGIVDFAVSFSSIENYQVIQYLKLKFPEREELELKTFIVDLLNNELVHHSNTETIISTSSNNGNYASLLDDEVLILVNYEIN